MKKLAVTISGAVSLGAYEAGVMYELLQALQMHNAANQDDPILIDVLTGASAGGMTSVILAQKLLFQPECLQEVFNNDLYLPWVKDIDLAGLLNLNSDEAAEMSILSSDLIESIAQRYLLSQYTTGLNIPKQKPHPAVMPQIKLGLAMSNLNGIDYGLNLMSGGAMPYTRFQDEVRIDIDSANPEHNSADFWAPILNAAVACGAFPFAFRVKDVLRDATDYQNPQPLKLPSTGMHFAYSDGGIFQNEPIGLAKRLVDEIDQHVNDQRYYIFIAPGVRQSASNDFSAAPGSSYFNYWNTGKTLIGAIFNQARYRDLENVEKVNQQVARFDQQAEGLKDLFLNGAVNSATFAPAIIPLLNAIFNEESAPLCGKGDASRLRLKAQFKQEYEAIVAAKGQENADAWVDAILLLETTASLGPKDAMQVFAITEDADKLAGDDLFAFGGFFDVGYRQHDYDRGRQSVRDFIIWLNGTPNTGLGPIQYPADSLIPIAIDTSLDGLKVESLSQSKRQTFRERLHDRIHDFLQEIGISWVLREAIDVGYLNGFLDKLLSL